MSIDIKQIAKEVALELSRVYISKDEIPKPKKQKTERTPEQQAAINEKMAKIRAARKQAIKEIQP